MHTHQIYTVFINKSMCPVTVLGSNTRTDRSLEERFHMQINGITYCKGSLCLWL